MKKLSGETMSMAKEQAKEKKMTPKMLAAHEKGETSTKETKEVKTNPAAEKKEKTMSFLSKKLLSK